MKCAYGAYCSAPTSLNGKKPFECSPLFPWITWKNWKEGVPRRLGVDRRAHHPLNPRPVRVQNKGGTFGENFRKYVAAGAGSRIMIGARRSRMVRVAGSGGLSLGIWRSDRSRADCDGAWGIPCGPLASDRQPVCTDMRIARRGGVAR